MRGQTNVIAMTLIITIGIAAATAYYISAQGIFTHAAQQSSYAVSAKIKTERFLRAIGGQIYPEGNIAHFVVQIYNGGDASIPYSFSGESIRWYLYRNGVLVDHGVSGSFPAPCTAAIPPGTICTYGADALHVSDSNLADMYLLLYVNEYGLRIPLNPVPYPGVKPFYVSCDSCSSCTERISEITESDENTGIIVFIPALHASGNCIDVNGKHNVTISCLGSVVGSGSGVGFAIENSYDISIHNCDISHFSTGILVQDSNDLSFSGVYSHDNTSVDVALAGDLAKSCVQGDWDLRTTRGRLLLVTGSAQTADDQEIGQVSGVWAMHATGYWLSAAQASTPAGLVDPIVLACDSNNVHISALQGNTAPRGIVLYHDFATQLDTVTISGVSQGILSYDSNGSSMYGVSIGFSGNSVFDNPESFEWGKWSGGVTFHD